MTTTTTNKVPSPECIYKDSDGDGDDDDADFCFAVPQSVHDRVASQADESNSAVVVLGESHENHSQVRVQVCVCVCFKNGNCLY
jgi:hypothetical protein